MRGEPHDLVAFAPPPAGLVEGHIARIKMIKRQIYRSAKSDLPCKRVVSRPDNYVSRPRIVDMLGLPSERYATIIHPLASVSDTSRVGPGSVLLVQAVLTAAVTVGSHVVIMPHVILTNGDVIGDFDTLASGVCLGGNVHVGH